MRDAFIGDAGRTPVGRYGARLIATAINQLHRAAGRYALCTMCIGVGQGIAMIVEHT